MTSELSDTVAKRVREVRSRLGWSVFDLAAQCAQRGTPGLTDNAIYAIETGRRKKGRRTRQVTVDEWMALAVALDVAPAFLLQDAEDEPRASLPGFNAH